MKILSVEPLAIPEVKVIRFARFSDPRGYFTELYRKSDFQERPEMAMFRGLEFVQVNESWSRAGVIRGLHFQFNPYVGKLLRTVAGRMVDLALDIRPGSPTYGKIVACDMPSAPQREFGEWIWVPSGFAHGNFFPEPTQIQYFCTGQWNPRGEGGISPLAGDLDWSLCDPGLKSLFDGLACGAALLSEKDRNGLTLADWAADPRRAHFAYKACSQH
ncbi:MAG: dTDP-4-dehydrorhamnose 3,5-epimerase family protein [Thermoguttaceae bacterium]|jgi:dTDP-4-dehydrorhamnose 3,5-epimerase